MTPRFARGAASSSTKYTIFAGAGAGAGKESSASSSSSSSGISSLLKSRWFFDDDDVNDDDVNDDRDFDEQFVLRRRHHTKNL